MKNPSKKNNFHTDFLRNKIKNKKKNPGCPPDFPLILIFFLVTGIQEGYPMEKTVITDHCIYTPPRSLTEDSFYSKKIKKKKIVDLQGGGTAQNEKKINTNPLFLMKNLRVSQKFWSTNLESFYE